MTNYSAMKVCELKELITDKEDFNSLMGVPISSARKNRLVEYLEHKNGKPKQSLAKSPSEPDLAKYMVNKPFDPAPPKIDKNFIPDTGKLEKIRESLPKQEVKVEEKPILDDEVTRDLDDDDVHHLSNILDGEVVHESPSYEYNECAEAKCKKYAELYPNIKPIMSSTDFKSSEEKCKYIEAYLNSTRMNANLTNYLFMATTYAERSETVNNYIKLRGYTARLAQRRNELETYIEELKIKYMDEVGQYLEMPVEARIGLLFAETAVIVHMENNKKELEVKVNTTQTRQPPVMKQ